MISANRGNFDDDPHHLSNDTFYDGDFDDYNLIVVFDRTLALREIPIAPSLKLGHPQSMVILPQDDKDQHL